MNDNIHFDTSTVRGFAEWLNHQVNGGQDGGGYAARIDTIIAKLGGSPGADEGEDLTYESDGSDAQTIGTSGVAYAGKDYGAAESKNAQAAVAYLNQMRQSLQGMADAAGVIAEDFTGKDGDNSEDMKEQFEPGSSK